MHETKKNGEKITDNEPREKNKENERGGRKASGDGGRRRGQKRKKGMIPNKKRVWDQWVAFVCGPVENETAHRKTVSF